MFLIVRKLEDRFAGLFLKYSKTTKLDKDIFKSLFILIKVVLLNMIYWDYSIAGTHIKSTVNIDEVGTETAVLNKIEKKKRCMQIILFHMTGI